VRVRACVKSGWAWWGGASALACKALTHARCLLLLLRLLHRLRSTQLTATDERVLQTNEAFLGIRIVKMNCWEEPIEKRIDEYRRKELAKLKTQERFIAGNRFAFFSIPIITALSTFVSYALLGTRPTLARSLAGSPPARCSVRSR
jgi:hypothetical protein